MEVATCINTFLTEFQITTYTQLAGDASFRKYYRLLTNKNTSLILMDTPVDRGMVNFIKIQNFLTKNHLPVPEILKSDLKNGFLLLSDLGTATMHDSLTSANQDRMYQEAIKLLIQMQLLTKDALDSYHNLNLDLMDNIYLRSRIRLFKYWYVEQYLDLPNNMIVDEICDSLIDLLGDKFATQAKVFTHHDYHSKNLMYQNNSLSIIDFQDAIVAPYTYDLISLLQDAYVALNQTQMDKLLEYYVNQAIAAGLFTHNDCKNINTDLDFVALSRHLKNLGIFARLAIRDNKTHYLQFIPKLQQYILDITVKYPRLSDLHDFMHASNDFIPQGRQE